jgi:hypothetical protein
MDTPKPADEQLDIRPLSETRAGCAGGTGSTESLRQVMRQYRVLFEELVEADADQPLRRERLDDLPVADRELGRRT